MKKISIVIALCCAFLIGCTEDNSVIPQNKKAVVGCLCGDGSFVVWRQDLIKSNSNLTFNPCFGKGEIKQYIYGN